VELMTTANETQSAASASFDLPDDDASIVVRLGPDVVSYFCNDAVWGTLLRTYRAAEGHVEVTAYPADPQSHTEGVVSASLTDVVLVPDDDQPGDPVLLEHYGFDMVEVWCCPG
jgi:hypothetical protein